MKVLYKFRRWCELVRIGNSLAIGFAAIVGYVTAHGGDLTKAVLLFTSASLVGAYGNVINDYFDREVDAVNKPWRPIPSGDITPRQALLASIVLALGGLIAASILSVKAFLIALIATLLLLAYSAYVKRTGIGGNFLIAILSGLSIVYGGVHGLQPEYSIIPAAYAFLLILGREFLKSLEDVEGDRMYGINTVAVTLGKDTAYMLSFVVLLSVVIISPLPYLLEGYSLLYLILAILGVDIPIIVALMISRDRTPEKAWKATRILKSSMFLGLVAFMVG